MQNSKGLRNEAGFHLPLPQSLGGKEYSREGKTYIPGTEEKHVCSNTLEKLFENGSSMQIYDSSKAARVSETCGDSTVQVSTAYLNLSRIKGKLQATYFKFYEHVSEERESGFRGILSQRVCACNTGCFTSFSP